MCDNEERKMGRLEHNSAYSRVLTELTSMLEELAAIANGSRALEAGKAQLSKAESRLWCCEVFMCHLWVCNCSAAELEDPLGSQASQDESAAAARTLGESGMADRDR